MLTTIILALLQTSPTAPTPIPVFYVCGAAGQTVSKPADDGSCPEGTFLHWCDDELTCEGSGASEVCWHECRPAGDT